MDRAATAFHMDRWVNSYARAADGATGEAGKQCAGNQNKEKFYSHGGLNRRGHGDDGGGDVHLLPHQSVSEV